MQSMGPGAKCGVPRQIRGGGASTAQASRRRSVCAQHWRMRRRTGILLGTSSSTESSPEHEHRHITKETRVHCVYSFYINLNNFISFKQPCTEVLLINLLARRDHLLPVDHFRSAVKSARMHFAWPYDAASDSGAVSPGIIDVYALCGDGVVVTPCNPSLGHDAFHQRRAAVALRGLCLLRHAQVRAEQVVFKTLVGRRWGAMAVAGNMAAGPMWIASSRGDLTAR